MNVTNVIKNRLRNSHKKETWKNIHYVYETCAKVFENNSSLKRHCITENHEYTEIYKELPKDAKSCDICFKIVTHLDIHKKLYHSDKNNNKSQHKCDKCDFKTTRKSYLKYHQESVHDGVRFACEKCDYIAKDRDYLRKHVKRRHLKLYQKKKL